MIWIVLTTVAVAVGVTWWLVRLGAGLALIEGGGAILEGLADGIGDALSGISFD